MIDDKKYWDLKEHVAYELEYETDPLPSDSSYREESNVWKSGNVETGKLQRKSLRIFKGRIENGVQSWDRKNWDIKELFN